jgi:hypothetical protein
MVERSVVRSEARCAWWSLLLLAIAGCSFDSAPIALSGGVQARPPNGDGAAPQAGAPAGSGDVEPDGGAAPVDMSPPVDEPARADASPSDASAPQSDASPSDAAAPSAATDAGGAPPADAGADAAADTGTTAEDASVPREGLFEPCETEADCRAGLVCYGSGYGYCAQPCDESAECADVDGVDFTCSSNDSACRVDCSANGTGGVCPQGLTCVEFGDDGRCLLPGVVGPDDGDRELFESCDTANGDDDCADGLFCYRAAGSRIDGPGFCTLECQPRGSVCADKDVSPAVLECEERRCRFACADAPCPDGMVCEEIGRGAVCHYPR